MSFEGFSGDEVVISGIGCKFPNSENLVELTKNLFDGENLVTPDVRRYHGGLFENLPQHSAKIKDGLLSDPIFFGISRFALKAMDPMVPLILQRSLEAVLDAGLNPSELKGTETNVISGTSISDYEVFFTSYNKEGYEILGRNRCMNSNRVSYWLDLHGTSYATYQSWTNGILNLKLAYDAIKNNHCDVALVSTASYQYLLESTIQMNDFGVLSPDGVCRSFDDNANGTVRGDAVVVYVLQRAKYAKRCYATIEHVVSTYFGDRDSPLRKPSQHEWETLLKNFYSESNIDVNDIAYVEGYGSGIREEDAAELNALSNVLCRNRKTPLLVGSCKSNLGHSEGAAALTSVTKALICLEKGMIPKNLHYSKPNSLCSGLFDGRLKVVTENTVIPPNGLVAVNCHGFGGSYAHIVLRANPISRTLRYDGIPRLVLLSDRSDENMESNIKLIEDTPFNPEFIDLVNAVYCKHVQKYMGRGYTIVPKVNDTSISEHKAYPAEKRPVWFIFSGMGSQWPKMGKGLMQLPLFRESIEKSHKILETKGLDLIDIITRDDKTIFDNILHSFVGIAAIQIALVDILTALGVEPNGMIGHSVGELGCAYADGCFTAEQMLLAAYYRGKASIETDLIKGFMAAVGKGYNQIKDELPKGIEVACHNAADSCTISGPAEMVQDYVEILKSKGIFAKTVNVSNIAYHSQYIKPAAPKLLQYLKEIIPKPKLRSHKWISTSNNISQWHTRLARYSSAEYHTNNLLSSVLFEEGSKNIPENAICIEIAPHGLLQAILKRSLGERVINIPLTNRTAEDSLIFLLQAIGKMHIAGIETEIANLYEKVEYPVSRGTPSIEPLVHWQKNEANYRNIFHTDKRVKYSLKTHFLQNASQGIGYYINDKNVYPVSVLLHLVWTIFSSSQKEKSTDNLPVIFTKLRFESPVSVQDHKGAENTEDVDNVTLAIQPATGGFEICSKYLITSGIISTLKEKSLAMNSADSPEVYILAKNEIYHYLKCLGYHVGSDFQNLESVVVSQDGWRGKIAPSANIIQTIESLIQLQFLHKAEKSSFLLFPFTIEKLEVSINLHREILKDSNGLDVFFNQASNIMCCGGIEMKGLKFQKIPKISNLQFESAWFPQYEKPSFSDFWKFVDFSFDIAFVNRNSKKISDFEVLEITDDVSSAQFVPYLEKSYPDLKLRMESVSESLTINNDIKKDFIIARGSYLRNLESFIDSEGFVLVHLTGSDQHAFIPNSFEVISKFEDELALLKKKEILNGRADFIIMPSSDTVLLNILKKLKSRDKVYYIIGYNEPEEGVEKFQIRLQRETDARLRWMFILDETAPAFDRNLPLYSNQIAKGLTNNVYYKGGWRFFHRKQLTEKNLSIDTNLIKSSKELIPSHVVLDLNDNHMEINQVEFSGRLKTGTRVFGISKPASNRLQSIVCDEHYTWELPSNWTFEDGATVPLSYLLAYYCIQIVSKAESKNDRVLVTDGLSCQGQAVVAVALSLSLPVYVTVNNEEEKSQFKNLFPEVDENDIYIHSNSKFDMELGLRTKGENATIIINLLEGENLTACLNCIGTSRNTIFHFGKEDFRKNVQMGTLMFLLITSFHGISKELLDGLGVEEKKLLHDYVLRGIKEGVVKPLPRESYTADNVEKIRRASNLIGNKKKIVLKVDEVAYDTKKLRIDPNSSYLIIDNDSDLWVDVTDWLVKQGVSNVVIHHTDSNSGHKSARRTKISRKHKNIKCYNDDGSKNVDSLLEEAIQLGPIAAVFFISMDTSKDSQIAFDLHKSYKDKTGHYVAITTNQTTLSDVCVERTNEGYSATNFIWRVDESLISQNLDFMKKVCGREPVIEVSYCTTSLKQNTELLLVEQVPSTIEDYCKLGLSLNSECRLIELKTLAASHAHKEASPIIMIPGLQKSPVDFLAPLTKHFIYPAYCVQLPGYHYSIKQIASLLLPKILKLRKASNYFNIIGISWGSYISIELCKLLEGLGATVSLILIDGPLHDLREALIANKTLDADLINLIRGLSTKIDNEELPHETFQGKLDYVIRHLDLTLELENALRRAAFYIKHSLQAMMDYDYSSIKLEGPISVLGSGKSLDNTDIGKICNNVSVQRISVSRSNLLSSNEVKNSIHGRTIDETMSKNSLLTSYSALEEFIVRERAIS